MVDKALDVIMSFFLWVAILLAFGTLILFPVACYNESKKETFSLKKDEWSCSKEETKSSVTYLWVNNIAIPQTYTTTSCIQWNKIK